MPSDNPPLRPCPNYERMERVVRLLLREDGHTPDCPGGRHETAKHSPSAKICAEVQAALQSDPPADHDRDKAIAIAAMYDWPEHNELVWAVKVLAGQKPSPSGEAGE